MRVPHYLFAVEASELQAGWRVLEALLNSDNPQVQREIEQSLADSSREQAVKCARHLRAAYLAGINPDNTEEEDGA